MIAFGPWSTTLAAGMVFGLLVALLLASSPHNRVANRLLAGVLAVFALKLLPYVIGFAGFYDVYPWLSFAPTSFGLALGPLIYLHVCRIVEGRLRPRWWLHLVPVAVQCAYYCVMFVQPMSVRDAFAVAWDGPLIDPIETWLELGSLLAYLVLAWRRLSAYQAWLDATLSNREQFRLPWLRRTLILLFPVTVAWAAFELASALSDFNYFQRFPLYLGITGLLGYLGLEGWRHAGIHYPVQADADERAQPDALEAAPALRGEAGERDWTAQGRQWRDALSSHGWWRDPDLSVDTLARHLGTNTNYLSRAFNDGLGLSFNAVVNQLRVEAIEDALRRGEGQGDLLALGLAAGFNSKTSFNRVFKACTGLTPSQYRAAHALHVPNPE